jgi:hypothetical protein
MLHGRKRGPVGRVATIHARKWRMRAAAPAAGLPIGYVDLHATTTYGWLSKNDSHEHAGHGD